MDDAVIKVEHLEAGYPGVTVLHDVNFSVKRGEVFALLGGSGKWGQFPNWRFGHFHPTN